MPANTIPQTSNVLDLLCYQPMAENSTSSLVEVHHDLPQAVWLDVLFYAAPRSGRTLDCFVPIYVEHNINYVIFRACFQHCLHVSIGEISEGRNSIRLSRSYYQCLSIDDKKRWRGMKWNCLRTVYVFCHYISQFRLFPMRSVPFISARDTGTGRSSCSVQTTNQLIGSPHRK